MAGQSSATRRNLPDEAAPVSRTPFSLEVLKIASFRNLLTVELIGSAAFEARIWALAWIIWSLTESAAWIGVIFGIWAIRAVLTRVSPVRRVTTDRSMISAGIAPR